MRLLLLVLLLASPVWGCGQADPIADPDGGTDPDGGVDAGPPPPDPVPPDPAALPSLPVLTPCPDGWREVADPAEPALVVCDPWPEGGPLDCPADAAHFPGEPGCARIGPACPAGDFADDLPVAGVIVYVRAGADPDGDGTRQRPFATIAAALAVAPAEAVIALSKGTFQEPVLASAPVSLWGACVAETILEAPAFDLQPMLQLSGGFHGVRNVTVTGPRPGIGIDEVEAPVVLDSVVVREVDAPGIHVGQDALLTASNLLVRDVSVSLSSNVGLTLAWGAQVALARCAFERAGKAQIRTDFLSGLEATNLAVRGTPTSDAEWGAAGLDVANGRAILQRAAFQGNADSSIMVFHPAGSLQATDLVVEDGVPRRDGTLGVGLFAGSDAVVELTRARFDRNSQSSLAFNPASATLTDVLVRDTRPRTQDVRFGNGIEVLAGTVQMIRVAVFGSHQAGLLFHGDALAAARDLIVRDTHAMLFESNVVGSGITLRDGGRLSLLRAEVTRCEVCGILATGATVALSASDLTIVDSGPADDEGLHGQGLCADEGAQVRLYRARLEGNRTAAVDLRDAGTALIGTDVTLVDTAPERASGRYGVGALVLDGAQLSLDRVLVDGNRLAGVLAQGSQSLVTLTSGEVSRTLAQECAASSCPGEEGGLGLAVLDGAALDLTRFAVSDMPGCGVLVASGAGMDLHHGRVQSSAVGACVADEDFVLSRLQEGVLYVDDDVDVDGSPIWLPDGRSVADPF